MQNRDEFDALISSLPDGFKTRFEIKSKIGSGATGTVYEGWDKTLSRQLAIKVLNPEHAKEEKILRLHKEAKTLCKLSHHHIVGIYDFIVTTDNKPVLVMEYVDGFSLESLIEGGSIDVADVIEIFMQICEAMQYAHGRGVLHRDLTPANILLYKGEHGAFEPKVVDFGIAKIEAIQDRTIAPSGSLVGSITVISPEQARGRGVDARSDVYSLGCTMFKALTSEFPYQGDSLLEIVNKHLNEDVPLISERSTDRGFPSGLESVVAKAMQKDPALRFQSMNELRDALKETVSAGSDDLIEQDKREPSNSSKTMRVTVVVASAITILFLAVVTISMFSSPPKGGPRESKETVNLYVQNDSQWVAPLNGDIKSLIAKLRSNPRLKRVSLKGEKFSNEDLEAIVQNKIESLDVRDTDVDDQSLAIIAKCQSIRSLVLINCKGITDDGAKSIGKLHKVMCLGLSKTPITSSGLKSIFEKNSIIHALILEECDGINDESIPLLLTLPKLESLRITGTKISRDGVRTLLQDCKSLGSIHLQALGLEDGDFPRFSNVSRIDVSNNTKLTTEVLVTFDRWPNLYFVNVDGIPNISIVAGDKLQKRHPERRLVVYPTDLLYDASRHDSEAYFEPRLYDRTQGNQQKMRELIIEWGGVLERKM